MSDADNKLGPRAQRSAELDKFIMDQFDRIAREQPELLPAARQVSSKLAELRRWQSSYEHELDRVKVAVAEVANELGSLGVTP